MKQIGLTGGIGSGKSTIAKAFEALGAPVYVADTRAKWLNENDVRIVSGLKSIVAPDIYNEFGRLDRRRMAAIIFSDKEKLSAVNALVHPIVREDYDKWLAQQRAPYVVYEAAIMVEDGSYRRFDEIIVATAPIEQRIARVVVRDKTTAEAVRARINNQIDDEERLRIATYRLITDDHNSVLNKIIEIHEKLC